MAGLKRIAPVTSVSEPGKAALGLIQRRVHMMTDSELLRFGLIAKFECSELQREAQLPSEILMAELEELRAEWKRRFPEMPLRDSF